MKRFIRYLYEYEEGKRSRNVGFVKVEDNDWECMIHIYGKGLHMQAGQSLGLYLFFEEEDRCIGIYQGEIENINPAVNYRLRYTKEDTGEPVNYTKIRGVILSDQRARKYAAVWDDMPVDVDHMKLWVEKETPKEEQQTSVRCHGRKIQRQELSQLPRCEWRLSNNQFLLHGYYNYHHLVFLEENKMMYVGVPGIFHENEAKAAGVFGFPKFIPVNETDLELDSEEREEEEQFGYWCRQIRNPFRQ